MTGVGLGLVGAAVFAAWELACPAAVQWTAIIGGALLVLAQVVWWASELRNWARLRRRARPPAYGTFLFADAVVRRYPKGCDDYPRSSVLEVFEEWESFNRRRRHTPSIRYMGAGGKQGAIKLAWMLEEAEGVHPRIARRWLAQTAPPDREGS